ncbi:MAG: MoaD/ThiS family protein [Desulfurococcaceae archaeon]
MPIKIKLLETGDVVELSAKRLSVKELLEKLKLSASENLVLKGKTILTEEDEIVDGDEVVVFTVKSGG